MNDTPTLTLTDKYCIFGIIMLRDAQIAAQYYDDVYRHANGSAEAPRMPEAVARYLLAHADAQAIPALAWDGAHWNFETENEENGRTEDTGEGLQRAARPNEAPIEARSGVSETQYESMR